MAEHWQNTEWQSEMGMMENEKDSTGMGMTEHGITAYPLPS
jgi:hypothetical protein